MTVEAGLSAQLSLGSKSRRRTSQARPAWGSRYSLPHSVTSRTLAARAGWGPPVLPREGPVQIGKHSSAAVRLRSIFLKNRRAGESLRSPAGAITPRPLRGERRMDYFQGVVTEYLRAKRSQFVNTEYMINLDLDGTYLKDRHWYCDAVAIDFADSTVHLCEVTYSKTLQSLCGRLRAWGDNWPELVGAIRRDSALRGDWHGVPRLFVPEEWGKGLEDRLRSLGLGDGSLGLMPSPVIPSLEEVLPWKYRSWNGQPFERRGVASDQ